MYILWFSKLEQRIVGLLPEQAREALGLARQRSREASDRSLAHFIAGLVSHVCLVIFMIMSFILLGFMV